MNENILINKLKDNFKNNEPIFTEEILSIMNNYSRQRIYQLIDESIKDELLLKYDNGVYFMPTKSEFGNSIINIEQVINKKYISNKGKKIGIYGKSIIELNFLISTQVPNTIEVITNNESRKVRNIEIAGFKIILRKARIPINNKNEAAYTLLELFTGIDVKKYQRCTATKNEVKKYIEENKINRNDILKLINYFPSKTIKNLVMSEVIYDIARE